MSKESIAVKWIDSIDKKPDQCVQCGNTKLRSDIIQGTLGGKKIDHEYCSKCECLMIFPQ